MKKRKKKENGDREAAADGYDIDEECSIFISSISSFLHFFFFFFLTGPLPLKAPKPEKCPITILKGMRAKQKYREAKARLQVATEIRKKMKTSRGKKLQNKAKWHA
jgi:hypothetical protein